MNTYLKYVIGLDLLNWHAKFVAIRSAVLGKMTFEGSIFCNFPDIPEVKLSLPFWVYGGRMNVLQSYRSCTFCKHKTRGETQF